MGERYTRDPEPFDWYQRWAGLKDVLMEYIQTNHQVMNLGCGNSRLSEEMYEEGFHNITNVDISLVAIKAMQEKYADNAGMIYQQMDCRSMEFPDGVFNVVLDKGSLDSILCGEGSTHNAQKPMMGMTASLASDDKDNVHYIYVCTK